MDTANNLVMNINESLGGGFALPFMKQGERRPGLRLAAKLSHPFRAHIVAFLGELLGTFLFLFFSFAGVANSQSASVEDVVSRSMYISLAFGFALLVNAWTFFRVSGGLFNPAVTWGMCLIGALSWFRGLLVFIAQIVGSILAGAFVKALFPGNLDVRTAISDGTSLSQALFIETIMTLQLVLVIFLLAAEKHKATFIAPVGIGLALFSGMLASIRYTGASMNPARSFGPCVSLPGFHSYHWVYWVGPLLGSTIAVLIYKLIKTLEYETANPGQDDTGEEKADVEEQPRPSSRSSGSRRRSQPQFPREHGSVRRARKPAGQEYHNNQIVENRRSQSHRASNSLDYNSGSRPAGNSSDYHVGTHRTAHDAPYHAASSIENGKSRY